MNKLLGSWWSDNSPEVGKPLPPIQQFQLQELPRPQQTPQLFTQLQSLPLLPSVSSTPTCAPWTHTYSLFLRLLRDPRTNAEFPTSFEELVLCTYARSTLTRYAYALSKFLSWQQQNNPITQEASVSDVLQAYLVHLASSNSPSTGRILLTSLTLAQSL